MPIKLPVAAPEARAPPPSPARAVFHDARRPTEHDPAAAIFVAFVLLLSIRAAGIARSRAVERRRRARSQEEAERFMRAKRGPSDAIAALHRAEQEAATGAWAPCASWVSAVREIMAYSAGKDLAEAAAAIRETAARWEQSPERRARNMAAALHREVSSAMAREAAMAAQRAAFPVTPRRMAIADTPRPELRKQEGFDGETQFIVAVGCKFTQHIVDLYDGLVDKGMDEKRARVAANASGQQLQAMLMNASTVRQIDVLTMHAYADREERATRAVEAVDAHNSREWEARRRMAVQNALRSATARRRAAVRALVTATAASFVAAAMWCAWSFVRRVASEALSSCGAAVSPPDQAETWTQNLGVDFNNAYLAAAAEAVEGALRSAVRAASSPSGVAASVACAVQWARLAALSIMFALFFGAFFAPLYCAVFAAGGTLWTTAWLFVPDSVAQLYAAAAALRTALAVSAACIAVFALASSASGDAKETVERDFDEACAQPESTGAPGVAARQEEWNECSRRIDAWERANESASGWGGPVCVCVSACAVCAPHVIVAFARASWKGL